jgi:transposase
MGISRNREAYKTCLIEKDVVKDFVTGEYYCEDLAKKYKVDVHTIYRILNKNNISRKAGRHSSCNEEYFEKIDNPNKAYLLGFITADGAITGKYSSSCSIEIHEKDSELLEFARKQINPSATITDCNYKNKHNKKVSFSSKKMCDDLKKYGIIPNKSLILKKVPSELIPEELLCYYFRGLIDGDGCIHKNGEISIYSGSRDFIEDVQKVLCDTISVRKLKIYHGTTFFVSWSTKDDRKKFFDFLYKDKLDKTFFYKRKYIRLYNSLHDNNEIT